jgi:serine protease inhibitor
MNKRSVVIMSILAIILSICLLGCSTTIDVPKQIEPVKSEPEIVETEKTKVEVSETMNIGFDKFDSDLINYIENSEDYKTENFVVSPVSIKLALGLTIEGAEDETKTEMLKALDIERNWYKEIGLGEDEKAPQVMFFIIDNDEIKDTKLVDRQDVYTYKPQANEYYLDRTRDSGFDLTDYNLSHVQKMVDSWNESKKFEDVDSLCDKIDNATSDLQALIKSLAATKNTVVESINKCLAEALEEEIWGVEMFLDTVDGDPEPGHVEFTRDSLIDFLNDYGYELSKDASDEEIKECAEDYEMTIKYIRKPN